jgi:hypothetical protein
MQRRELIASEALLEAAIDGSPIKLPSDRSRQEDLGNENRYTPG